jgi:hypothetical protein
MNREINLEIVPGQKGEMGLQAGGERAADTGLCLLLDSSLSIGEL